MRNLLFAGAAAAALAMPASALAVTYTGAGFAIPDNNATGASSTITVSDDGVVDGVDLALLGFSHTWVGDLSGSLTHAGITVDWMKRTDIGADANLSGNYIIRDGAAVLLNKGAGSPIAPGVYAGDDPFSAFNGTSWLGDWTLTITDHALFDTGALASWDLNLDVSTSVPEPSTWALTILGFGALGAAMRRRRVVTA